MCVSGLWVSGLNNLIWVSLNVLLFLPNTLLNRTNEFLRILIVLMMNIHCSFVCFYLLMSLMWWCVQAALLAPMEDESVAVPDDRKATLDFPPPAGREILLRTRVPRPAPYSRTLPQRLFCVLMREEFRLAGAFSSDTSFFWTHVMIICHYWRLLMTPISWVGQVLK